MTEWMMVVVWLSGGSVPPEIEMQRFRAEADCGKAVQVLNEVMTAQKAFIRSGSLFGQCIEVEKLEPAR